MPRGPPKTFAEKLSLIKRWYGESVPPTVAVYDQKVIDGIKRKNKEIDDSNNLLDIDYNPMSPEDDGYEPYDFKVDVFPQKNPFEYYKLALISEHYDGSDHYPFIPIPIGKQFEILNIYKKVYQPLLKKLNEKEKKFLNDFLKLVGGTINWYGPLYDSARPYDEGTKIVSRLEPILPPLKPNTKSATKKQRKRCPNGTRRNKKSGKCETAKKGKKQQRKRCPNGTRRNKKSGKCEKK